MSPARRKTSSAAQTHTLPGLEPPSEQVSSRSTRAASSATENAPPRLFVVDTMAVIYRAHFAMLHNPLINSRGINVSGLHGLLHTLVHILLHERANYLAVATDSSPTFRHRRYPEYKATRERMPEELARQLPYIERITQALQLPLLIMEDYEADDLIATLAERAKAESCQAFLVTGDKDCMQLIGPTVFMYAIQGGSSRITGAQGVRERFGCAPEQIVDLLALMGDSSDNIPGVPGVGVKTAARLLDQFGNLEQLYDRLDEVRGKLRETLETNRESAFLSQELVTLCRDLPLQEPFSALKVSERTLFGNAELTALLTELEFQSLRDRLLSGDSTQAEERTARPQGRWYILKSPQALAWQVERWRQSEMLAFDTETEGLDPLHDALVGVSISATHEEAYYIPFNHPRMASQREQLLALLKPLLEDPAVQKVAHNAKFDLQVFAQAGIQVQGVAHDTMIASHLVEPSERRHNLDSVSLRCLGYTKIPTAAILGKGRTQRKMSEVPIPQVGEYACEDADITRRLTKILAPRLRETEQENVYRNLELPLIPVLAKMEQEGIRFDAQGSRKLSVELGAEQEHLRTEIYALAGEEFNVHSVPALQSVLYTKLRLHEQLGVRPRRIRTGAGFSTDEETLTQMQAHPLPQTLLRYRELAKLRNTYLDALPGFVHPHSGRIHTRFRQTAAATGRLASDHPNLQNIPIRTPLGRRIRALFLPRDENHMLLSADYSQIELRVLADYSADPSFLRAFQRDEDVHALTAAAIFEVAEAELSREMRSVAKEVNFGLIYRMGADRLAQITACSREEARVFIQRFFERYSSVRALQESFVAQARKEGYACTRMGRKRFLPQIQDDRNHHAQHIAEGAAINTPIQGTAAEIIKQAMIALERRLTQAGLRTRMVLSIHDELLFDAPKDELEELTQLVREEMEQAISLRVPLKVELGIGKNWLEAH